MDSFVDTRGEESIRFISEEMKEFEEEPENQYLNFRWQAVEDFSRKRPLIAKILALLLKNDPVS